MMAVAVVSAGISGYAGLLLSYYANLPSGLAIILAAGLIYVLSIALGTFGGPIWFVLPRRHLQA
jgi:zinc/manganese transport system permease protein